MNTPQIYTSFDLLDLAIQQERPGGRAHHGLCQNVNFIVKTCLSVEGRKGISFLRGIDLLFKAGLVVNHSSVQPRS